MKIVLVIHKKTGEEVPFRYLPSGEIQIVSTNPKYNDENCIVTMCDNDRHGRMLLLS